MERRVLLAIFLCFLVLYVWQALFVKPVPRRPASSTASSSPAPAATTSPSEISPAASGAVSEPPAPTATATPVLGATAEQDYQVENRHVVAVFTNRGARLKSWKLKAYQDRNQRPLELVATQLASTGPLAFSLRLPDADRTATLNNALYIVQDRALPGNTLKFEYRDAAGLIVTKEFRLDPDAYTVTAQIAVSDAGQPLAPAIEWGPGLGDSDSQVGRSAVSPGGITSAGGTVTRVAAQSVASQPVQEGEFDYAGIEDHYFLSLALKPGPTKITYRAVSIPAPQGSKEPAREYVDYALEPARRDLPLVFYVGPKDFETLAAIDRNLVKAINFGMFSVIVVPLLRSLNWIHGFVGNYGWSIVVLTMILNLVLFPLNHKSVVSMRKMQEIQPEMKAIQARYSKLKATDPERQKMNQEMMALYRERGVNPASGCVPILLTLPIFLAFYALLTTAIELRGAPFVGWIRDLSQPDAYYVMPILVGVSQVWLQWMTPQTGVDPTQQRMMMIMPIVLIFVFVSTPAGALIYWLVQNVWRVVQQSLTNYLIGPPAVRTVRPAAERQLKRVGAGKTEGAARES